MKMKMAAVSNSWRCFLYVMVSVALSLLTVGLQPIGGRPEAGYPSALSYC